MNFRCFLLSAAVFATSASAHSPTDLVCEFETLINEGALSKLEQGFIVFPVPLIYENDELVDFLPETFACHGDSDKEISRTEILWTCQDESMSEIVSIDRFDLSISMKQIFKGSDRRAYLGQCRLEASKI